MVFHDTVTYNKYISLVFCKSGGDGITVVAHTVVTEKEKCFPPYYTQQGVLGWVYRKLQVVSAQITFVHVTPWATLKYKPLKVFNFREIIRKSVIQINVRRGSIV